MPIPAHLIPIGEGMLPDGTRVPFFVDKRELDSVRDNGPAWKYHDAGYIIEAVGDPDAIFEGLQRPNQNDSFCYSVRPTRDPDADEGDETEPALPPVFGQAFLAFVTLEQMGFVVFDWEWRAESADEPGHPENWQSDFARRVWQRP